MFLIRRKPSTKTDLGSLLYLFTKNYIKKSSNYYETYKKLIEEIDSSAGICISYLKRDLIPKIRTELRQIKFKDEKHVIEELQKLKEKLQRICLNLEEMEIRRRLDNYFIDKIPLYNISVNELQYFGYEYGRTKFLPEDRFRKLIEDYSKRYTRWYHANHSRAVTKRDLEAEVNNLKLELALQKSKNFSSKKTAQNRTRTKETIVASEEDFNFGKRKILL